MFKVIRTKFRQKFHNCLGFQENLCDADFKTFEHQTNISFAHKTQLRLSGFQIQPHSKILSFYQKCILSYSGHLLAIEKTSIQNISYNSAMFHNDITFNPIRLKKNLIEHNFQEKGGVGETEAEIMS